MFMGRLIIQSLQIIDDNIWDWSEACCYIGSWHLDWSPITWFIYLFISSTSIDLFHYPFVYATIDFSTNIARVAEVSVSCTFSHQIWWHSKWMHMTSGWPLNDSPKSVVLCFWEIYYLSYNVPDWPIKGWHVPYSLLKKNCNFFLQTLFFFKLGTVHYLWRRVAG